MTANSLIDLTLEKIAKGYSPGTLPWIKVDRPDDWRRMVGLEGEINERALKEDISELKKVLEHYQELIFSMVKKFETPKGKPESCLNG